MAEAVTKLLANVHDYQFQQVIRILENHWQNPDRQIKFSAANQVTFPGADIQSIAVQDKRTIQLALNFMGLYGVDSPLPHYLNSMSLAETEDAQRFRHWLDIIHQLTYKLFYQAWKQRRVYVQLNDDTHPYHRYLEAISGGLLQTTDKQEFSQAAVLGARVKTSAGLSSGLKALLHGVPVQIKQFQPSNTFVNHGGKLGTSELRLADNMLLGNRVLSVQNRINIEVGPVTWQVAQTLWPNTARAEQLRHYIKRYLKININFELVIKIFAKQKPLMCLGKTDDYLAWSSWLGEPLGETYSMQVG
jgi:type VI secretion system protein ImpH